MCVDALKKEMSEVNTAVEVLVETVNRAFPEWLQVTGHLVWDVRVDLERKAR